MVETLNEIEEDKDALFKIGEKVLVRCNANYIYKDELRFVPDMERFLGVVCTVKGYARYYEADKPSDKYRYMLEEAPSTYNPSGYWLWHEDWLDFCDPTFTIEDDELMGVLNG